MLAPGDSVSQILHPRTNKKIDEMSHQNSLKNRLTRSTLTDHRTKMTASSNSNSNSKSSNQKTNNFEKKSGESSETKSQEMSQEMSQKISQEESQSEEMTSTTITTASKRLLDKALRSFNSSSSRVEPTLSASTFSTTSKNQKNGSRHPSRVSSQGIRRSNKSHVSTINSPVRGKLQNTSHVRTKIVDTKAKKYENPIPSSVLSYKSKSFVSSPSVQNPNRLHSGHKSYTGNSYGNNYGNSYENISENISENSYGNISENSSENSSKNVEQSFSLVKQTDPLHILKLMIINKYKHIYSVFLYFLISIYVHINLPINTNKL